MSNDIVDVLYRIEDALCGPDDPAVDHKPLSVYLDAIADSSFSLQEQLGEINASLKSIARSLAKLAGEPVESGEDVKPDEFERGMGRVSLQQQTGRPDYCAAEVTGFRTEVLP